MCCRYTLQSRAAVNSLLEKLPPPPRSGSAPADWLPRYNVALTSPMPVIIRQPVVTLESMQFDLVRPARSPAGKPLILGNARAETLLDKPSFRAAAQTRRCLVPADGFYEWEKAGAARLPHYFTLQDRQPFFFAGIWEAALGDSPAAFCLITTAPNALVRRFHDRMPVILGPTSGPAWLGDQPLDPAQLAQLCRPLPADRMCSHRVDPRVNNVRHDSPDCIAPV